MNKEQRVLNQFLRKDVDYLPSQITFSSRKRDKEIATGLGIKAEELDDYLGNHIFFTYNRDDIPLFFNNDNEEMRRIEALGHCKTNWEDGVVYDNWGMGILRGEDGFFTCFGPIVEDEAAKKRAKPYMPERIKEILDMPMDEAIHAFTPPDPLVPGNLEWYERDIKKYSGDFMVIPSGYFGIYERAYATLGWERFMTEIALSPELIYELMEKITDYRMTLAQAKADLGFKIVHHGDDLGTQYNGFFAPQMFEEIILPHLKRLYGEYKRLGLYVVQHSCGNIIQYLPQLIDAGLDGIEPVQPCMDLKFLKREFGKDLVFWGGIDTQTLPIKTPKQVREMTKETISILGKGGGHIIAPSQELMGDVPLENVIALVETIMEMRDKVM